MQDFLSIFLGNQHRARVIRALSANEFDEMSIATIAKRSGVQLAVVKREMRALAGMKLLRSSKRTFENEKTGRKKTDEVWALGDHKYARALSAFVREVSPTQFIEVERAIKAAGKVSALVLTGLFVGDHSRPADLLIAGDINQRRLERVVRALEPKFGREIRYALLSTPEFRYRLTVQDRLLRDVLDFPHRVLVDRTGIL
jgi:hypothetical protein